MRSLRPSQRGVIAALWGSPKRAVSTASTVAFGILAASLLVPAIRDFLGTLLLVASPLIVLAKAFPNESKQFASRVLEKASAVSQTVEREAVRQDLEGTLSIGAQRLRAIAPSQSVLPLRIDYLKSGQDVDRLPDGTLIVGVSNHGSRERNLVAAAWAYVQNGVLPESRDYLDPEVSHALDFVLTRQVLEPAGPSAVREFMRILWAPAVIGEARLRALCEKLDRLQYDQLLGPILLAEFDDLARTLGLRFPTAAIQLESAAFVDYLHDLATREPGTNVGELANFNGSSIKCRVVFVARPDVYLVKGPEPHRKAIDWALRRAYHRVYLLGLGRNSDYVREVADPYRSDGRIRSIVESETIREYPTGRRLRQVIIRLSVDVRYGITVGRHAMVAVGPGRPVIVDPDRDTEISQAVSAKGGGPIA